jgi:hypothetical protein
MTSKIWIGIVAAALALGTGALYWRDSATLAQANAVEVYLQDYCRAHGEYPDFEKVAGRFPEQYTNQEWYYWPNETLTGAAFQYPMTLPLPAAPGRAKISEFLPIIYAYAVQHPCNGILRQASMGDSSALSDRR